MAHGMAIKIEVAKYNSFGKLFTRNAQCPFDRQFKRLIRLFLYA